MNIIFVASIFFKLSVISVAIYSCLTIIVASRFVIKLFRVCNLGLPFGKILLQHILLNCFDDSIISIACASSKKINLHQTQVIFDG